MNITEVKVFSLRNTIELEEQIALFLTANNNIKIISMTQSEDDCAIHVTIIYKTKNNNKKTI